MRIHAGIRIQPDLMNSNTTTFTCGVESNEAAQGIPYASVLAELCSKPYRIAPMNEFKFVQRNTLATASEVTIAGDTNLDNTSLFRHSVTRSDGASEIHDKANCPGAKTNPMGATSRSVEKASISFL